MNNHYNGNNGNGRAMSKITNLQEQKVLSTNQINTVNQDNLSPENSDGQSLNNSASDDKQKILLLKIANNNSMATADQDYSASSSLLSPPTSTRRRGSSVMFNEYVILHTPPAIPEPQPDKNAFSLEKMTQTGDGTIWQVC